jgi:hypothetical protein
MIEFYVIIKADGTLRRGSLYKFQKKAERAAKYDGDSVVKVEIPHTTTPVFIRGKIIG